MPFKIFASRRAKWSIVAAAVLVAVVGVFLLRNRKPSEITISRQTTFLEGPIGEDGYIDYVAAVNAKMAEGVTPENNAVVLLVQVFGPAKILGSTRREFFAKLGIPAPLRNATYFLRGHEFAQSVAARDPNSYATALEKELEKGVEVVWSRKELPKLAAWLRENKKSLEVAKKATHRPKWYCPAVPVSDGAAALISVPRPLVNECRDLANSLTARAMLAVQEGRVNDAQSDLLACHRLARLVSKGHTTIDFLVGIAIEKIALLAEIAALKTGRMTAKQLAEFQQALNELPLFESPAEKINFGERLGVLDIVVKVARGTLSEDEVGGTQGGLLSLAVLDWNIVLRTINERFDRLYSVLRESRFVLRKKSLDEHEIFVSERERKVKQTAGKWFRSSTDRSQVLGFIVVSMVEPGVIPPFASHDREMTRLQLTIIAIALERHRKATGKFPAELADLKPRYLKKIPQDLYTEKPLHYKPSKNGYRLYSVGPNMKDDGGRRCRAEDTDDIAVRMKPAK